MSKTLLSSETKIYKTESFFYRTKKMVGVDNFILKIAEHICPEIPELRKVAETVNCFSVTTSGREFTFLFKLGSMIKTYGIGDNDIVFFDMEGADEKMKSRDQRINLFLRESKIFSVSVMGEKRKTDDTVFKKTYLLSSSEYINFPMLSEKQQKLVEIQNENVLVQGVAGSGKTNICISKIIFTACRNYSGKILYTTFSRGLLIDTKNKIEIFKNTIKTFIDDYKNNRIVFLDKNHKKAIENRLGIFLVSDNERNGIKNLELIVDFLETHIDFKLLEDIYRDYYPGDFRSCGEEEFTKNFLPNLSNHQLKNRLSRIKNLSLAVIYKEIYGMIFGCKSGKMTEQEYKVKRENSFSREECEVIYSLAMEYDKYKKSQKLLDNNEISRILLENPQNLKKYTLSIIDEVQDYTEINLTLLKSLSIKLFCVGDALQMINPAYFSFSQLKNLMYNEDITNVSELECNYRNNKKIVELLDSLSEINRAYFGTHSFILKGESIDSSTMSNTVYTRDEEFLKLIEREKFENFTILVSGQSEKKLLREQIPKQEILTISEVKGLERETVILHNILSSNFDKWESLSRIKLSHKTADENSVYRYYFNLFYVGLSRAKHNIFVYEDKSVSGFGDFFAKNFENLSGKDAYLRFSDIIAKIEIDEDEIMSRILEFLKLGQFDNARFYAEKLEDDFESKRQLEKIKIYEDFIFKGNNKQAGIRFWKIGLIEEAKEQFEICGENKLIEFLERLENKNETNLDADVVRFFMDFEDNPDAQELIVDIVRQDLEQMKQKHRDIKNSLKNADYNNH